MLANLIFLITVIFSLCFVGLLWVRQNRLHVLGKLIEHEKLLRQDLQKQRDVLPLILEGLREEAQPSDVWRKMVKDRAEFHAPLALGKELAFEAQTKDFLAQVSCKSLRFLEGKKEFEELSGLIQKERETLKNLTLAYNEERKRFPYSLASAIFGLRELTV